MGIAENIVIGRAVRYCAGYGGIDGLGMIVQIHGEPNKEPPRTIGGIMRVISPNDCQVDVILADGRKLKGIRQASIDAPGIGIKLLDTVYCASEIPKMEQLAFEREVKQQLDAIQARVNMEAREAARVIEKAPIFYYNGIKDAKGEKLQKCWYSASQMINYPAGTITIYAKNYSRFSALVNACFAVKNDTDSQVDYFDSDRIYVIPAHPLYGQVKAAMEAQDNARAKRAQGRAA